MADFTTARVRIGGLKGVMRALGDAPEHEHHWKSMPRCPFCGKKNTAGVFNRGGVDFFKCFQSSCSSAGVVMSEVGYIAARLGLSESAPAEGGASPAYRKFLELAGCWEEKPINPQEPSRQAKDVGVTREGSVDPLEDQAPTGIHRPDSSSENGAAGASQFTQSAPLSPSVTTAATVELGSAVLKEFYKRLEPTAVQLVPDGKEFQVVSLMEKRGLSKRTCEALGFRRNSRENEKILQELAELYGWNELQASGLWLAADRKRKLDGRPNTQFCGKGIRGKKPEKQRKNRDDKWEWGWCQPVLIPYFNEAGELMKLRPHKGGAPSGTVAGRDLIYVPRDYRKCADMVEKFSMVVICEGEFKAAAIWQTIGLGRNGVRDPVGVCAIPGISFVRNIGVRGDLELWLSAVGVRRVIVAFDDEDHSDRPMRQRFDAQKYAKYLAADLSEKLHMSGMVANLPKEWRVNGKADWDGALAMLFKRK